MDAADVSIVGGGMFGVATALELADEGYAVTVFEQSDDILSAASYANQWRLHRGYHYPQSVQTARAAKESEPAFCDRFGEAVITEQDHYYAIAEESWVSPEQYRSFCDGLGLSYEAVETELIDEDAIAETLEVRENHVSVDRLKSLCWTELDRAGVEVNLNTHVESFDEISGDDYTVIATYAASNELLPEGHPLRREYQFEVCEIPVVQLPERYYGTNIIVVYGPFMSTDHWGDSNLFAMGDYVHMVHHSNQGYEPEVPESYARLLNKGLVKSTTVSDWAAFREHGAEYIPGVASATHVGSMFTVRTKLPDVEDTDARPSVVRRAGDIISVFGGKLSTCVRTGKQVRRELE